MKDKLRSFKLVRASACLVAILLPAAPVAAQSYSFTNIADDAGQFSGFRFLTGDVSPPSVNSSGTVAFRATLDAGGTGLFIGSGGPTTPIVDVSGPFFDLGIPSINDAATLAFSATLDAGGSGVFTGNGGPTTTIADESGPLTGFSFGNPQINSSGTVGFFAFFDSSADQGIFKGSGGGTTTIASDHGPGTVTGSFSDPSINASGRVALIGRNATGPGVFSGDGGATTTIADSTGTFSAFANRVPSINSAGTVAFFAVLDGGAEGIFTGDGGSTATIVDTAGPFSSFGNPSINDAGTVAFIGSLDAGGFGIFTGDDPLTDTVIKTGDALFGSTVTDLAFLHGLNNNGDIAFFYALADGRSGIARANVPEPAAGLAVLLLAVAGASRTRRRR